MNIRAIEPGQAVIDETVRLHVGPTVREAANMYLESAMLHSSEGRGKTAHKRFKQFQNLMLIASEKG